MVATSPAPTITVGFTLPYWLRYAMMLIGISCREEMFMIKNVHISSLAIPFSLATPLYLPHLLPSSSSSRASIACSPAGVAAQPSPSIFAIMFVVMYSFALCSLGIFGKKKCITGEIAFDKFWMIPAFVAISISPTHNDITPTIVIHSVTASLDESSAAFVIFARFPCNVPYIIPMIIIPAQRKFSIYHRHPQLSNLDNIC